MFCMEYMCLGFQVCKMACITLAGIITWLLTQSREGVIHGQRSILSVHEMGMHASIMNHPKAASYVSARQWLEHYAATHTELSPMDDKAYLPSGRKVFYYHQYRQDMIERGEAHGNSITEAGRGTHEQPCR